MITYSVLSAALAVSFLCGWTMTGAIVGDIPPRGFTYVTLGLTLLFAVLSAVLALIGVFA